VTVPQSTQTPASAALAALFATDDAMPEMWQAAHVLDRTTDVIVLLDTLEAWAAWTVILDHGCNFQAHVSEHLKTAQCVVADFPVLVLMGDMAETVCAA
jgi:hypothetical protein